MKKDFLKEYWQWILVLGVAGVIMYLQATGNQILKGNKGPVHLAPTDPNNPAQVAAANTGNKLFGGILS